ncbi:hypothetical protein EMIHUDRAFT_196170 [Emiliania huxleyi CCMP1516]|uniref:Uncharacterized protein n=2 Tax=Emiliania huxleyi TaxID=2903 RepID=A0A0D3J3L6_EMIH1|nr:hypothetical protein EMIHUDRAFT_196170 [Emiliania huxleyi CCMP1516]EOD18101.1 hypothetical protein EMIHUDRAFT_196170 [Emiliania huxleyi CCMP1516]|eukprot:XP_005770530.1 hypothetical protein EMIHUDRAFT_196170 [Emiliania huxleyi CCMP1516]
MPDELGDREEGPTNSRFGGRGVIAAKLQVAAAMVYKCDGELMPTKSLKKNKRLGPVQKAEPDEPAVPTSVVAAEPKAVLGAAAIVSPPTTVGPLLPAPTDAGIKLPVKAEAAVVKKNTIVAVPPPLSRKPAAGRIEPTPPPRRKMKKSEPPYYSGHVTPAGKGKQNVLPPGYFRTVKGASDRHHWNYHGPDGCIISDFSDWDGYGSAEEDGELAGEFASLYASPASATCSPRSPFTDAYSAMTSKSASPAFSALEGLDDFNLPPALTDLFDDALRSRTASPFAVHADYPPASPLADGLGELNSPWSDGGGLASGALWREDVVPKDIPTLAAKDAPPLHSGDAGAAHDEAPPSTPAPVQSGVGERESQRQRKAPSRWSADPLSKIIGRVIACGTPGCSRGAYHDGLCSTERAGKRTRSTTNKNGRKRSRAGPQQ